MAANKSAKTAPAPAVLPAQWESVLDTLHARALRLADLRQGRIEELGDLPTLTDLPEGLRSLSESLPLDDLDLALLVIAVAPTMDTRFEEVFARLNDDREARGPTAATALILAGASLLDGTARAHLHPSSPLLALGLLEAGPTHRSLLARVLIVPESVTGFLLDYWIPDPLLDRGLVMPERDPLPDELLPEVDWPDAATVVVRARAGTAALDHVRRAAFYAVGAEPLVIDGSLVDLSDKGRAQVLRACVRDVALLGTVLVLDLRQCSIDVPVGEIVAYLEHLETPAVVLIDGRRSLGQRDRSVVTLPLPDREQRRAWWALLAPNSTGDLAETATHLEPDDIVAAGDDESAALLRIRGTERRSRVQMIRPEIGLSDVVTSEEVQRQLQDLADRVRHRSLVLDEWRMRPGGGRGRGVTALFAGESGTGKSMSAEALAHELRVPLFKVDLASVVDKYIGETEKNLEEVFRSVENEDGVLLFDEADALFGKRSDVSDARDRYANIEVAYLLQRIESFDGLAILTTNLRANLDEAFQRRLDSIIDFPAPDAQARATIWLRALRDHPDALSDADLTALATLDLTGGGIRAAAISAAYAAAAQGTTIGRRHLLKGVREEWRKSGRLNFPTAVFADW